MKIPGYSNWFSFFSPYQMLTTLVDQAYDIAALLLGADKPLPADEECLRRIAADVRAIRQHLQQNDGHGSGKDVGQRAEESSGAYRPSCPTSPSPTSAHAPVLHSPKPEDAAEGPPPIAPDSVSGGGHPKTEDIVDGYWDTASSIASSIAGHRVESARLRRELDAARQERDNANARANATRLAP